MSAHLARKHHTALKNNYGAANSAGQIDWTRSQATTLMNHPDGTGASLATVHKQQGTVQNFNNLTDHTVDVVGSQPCGIGSFRENNGDKSGFGDTMPGIPFSAMTDESGTFDHGGHTGYTVGLLQHLADKEYVKSVGTLPIVDSGGHTHQVQYDKYTIGPYEIRTKGIKRHHVGVSPDGKNPGYYEQKLIPHMPNEEKWHNMFWYRGSSSVRDKTATNQQIASHLHNLHTGNDIAGNSLGAMTGGLHQVIGQLRRKLNMPTLKPENVFNDIGDGML